MKTFRVIIILAILWVFAVPVFAQSNQNAETEASSGISPQNESDMFYVSVPIEKIYPHHKGYVVLYRKGVNQMGRVYIPMAWFSGTDGKADLIRMGSGKAWPYLTLFYKAGEFSHLRLYVRREVSHETWGTIPLGTNLDDKFDGVETIHLEY